MGFLSNDGYLGIGRQTEKGSGIAPQKFANFISGAPNIENEMKQFKEGGFGRQGSFVKKVGMKMSPSLLVNMRPDIAGLLFTMALGSDVVASATAEITAITCEAAVNNKYWYLNSLTVDYYVWYNVNDAGVDPAITGKTPIVVVLTTEQAAVPADVATGTAAAITALSDFGAVSADAVVTVTNADKGAVEDAKDGNTTWTDAWSVSTPGVGGAEFETTTVACEADDTGSLNNEYWYLSSINADYYIWYNVNSAGADPKPAGKTGIEVALATDDADTVVATKTAAVLDAHADFVCPVPAAATITIVTADKGDVTNAADGNTEWTDAWTTTVEGVDGWLHTITPSALMWWSIEYGRVNDTLFERVEDSKVQSLTVAGAAGDFVTMAMEAVGLNVDSSVTKADPITYEVDTILQFLHGTFTVFGGESHEIRDFSLVLTNNLESIQTDALTYQQTVEKDLDVTFDATIKATIDDEYRKVHFGGAAGDAPSADVEESQVVLVFDNALTGEDHRIITITITKLAYMSMPLTELSAEGAVYQYAASGVAVKSGTSNLIDITVLNSQNIEYDALVTA